MKAKLDYRRGHANQSDALKGQTMRSIISILGATLLLGTMTSPAANAWYPGAAAYPVQTEEGGYFDRPTGPWNGGVGQPAVVNHYYSSGCDSCGGWAAPAGTGSAGGSTKLALGTALGATALNSEIGDNDVVGAASNAALADAHAPGVAAGSGSPYPIGAKYATLPAGCAYHPIGGMTYYTCDDSWLSPAYGANGIYYRVVGMP
jgi:hypothetical protein